MSTYTIKDLEQISGIKAHTIRVWEQRYNFLQPKRTETNIRSYSGEELKTILNVSLLNKYGYKISHIDRMSTLQMEEKILGLNQMDAQKEKVVNDLIKEMEQIVYSGTKLNIKYWIDELLDDDQQEEIHDYFMESESDKIEDALKEFDGEYDIDELRLMRIKFISEVAN